MKQVGYEKGNGRNGGFRKKTVVAESSEGIRYSEQPDHAILTSFSPFRRNREPHPWMGFGRYQRAESILEQAQEGFDVMDCFGLLQQVSQEVCPAVVSMVYDMKERTVYWCENRNYEEVFSHVFG